MTRAHTYRSGTDKLGREYRAIDGKRVSSDRFEDSFNRSLRAHKQQRRGARGVLEEPRGQFAPEERVEIFAEPRRIAHAIVITRERIRGTRQAILVRHEIPGMEASEARSYLESQYDRGGNYVLAFRQARTEYYGSARDEVEEEIGGDGSADQS